MSIPHSPYITPLPPPTSLGELSPTPHPRLPPDSRPAHRDPVEPPLILPPSRKSSPPRWGRVRVGVTLPSVPTLTPAHPEPVSPGPLILSPVEGHARASLPSVISSAALPVISSAAEKSRTPAHPNSRRKEPPPPSLRRKPQSSPRPAHPSHLSFRAQPRNLGHSPTATAAERNHRHRHCGASRNPSPPILDSCLRISGTDGRRPPPPPPLSF